MTLLRWKSWWKFINIMKIYQFCKNSLLYLKVFQFVENLSFWWKFILLMKTHHFDENEVTMVQLYESESLKIFGKGYVWSKDTYLILTLVLLCWFTTFLGWVGGWGKLRIKSISAQLKLKLGLSLAIYVHMGKINNGIKIPP